MAAHFDLSKEYNLDPEKERHGEKLYLDPDNQIYLLIARSGNENFERLYKKLPNRTQILFQAGKLSEEETKQYIVPIIAETILLGWERVAVNGKEVPYNRENAIKYLRKYKDFLLEVLAFSQDRDNFRPDEEQDAEKKSETSSS